MSVAVPVIDYIDGSTRRVYLRSGVVDFYPIEDIYHEYRYLRRTDESLRKWEALLKAEGNVPKGGGAFTPRYVVLLDGTKIVPFDEPSQLNQLGDMITDDPDTDATLYDISSLTTAKAIFIKPSEAETIQLNSAAIEFSSYNGGVTIDINSGNSGTLYPIGTDRKKVNNTEDALSIANSKGFNKLYIHSNLTVNSGLDYSGMVFQGRSHTNTVVQILDSANVQNVTMVEVDVSGVLDGGTDLNTCTVRSLVFFNGHIHNSALAGTIYMGGTEDALIRRSIQLTPDIIPIIDMLASNQNLIVVEYTGELHIHNLQNATSVVTVGLTAGSVILDSTNCTSGIIEVTGIGQLQDENGNYINSGIWNGGVVIKNGLLNVSAIARSAREFIHLNVDAFVNGDGLANTPFNNLADAYAECINSRVHALIIAGTVVFTGYNLDRFVIRGKNPLNAVCVLNGAGNTTIRTEFSNLILTGRVEGSIYVTDCAIQTISNVGSDEFPTLFKTCIIRPDSGVTPVIQLRNDLTTPQNIHFIDNDSGVPGTDTASLDFNGSNSPIAFRNYNGGLLFKNVTQYASHTFEMASGQLKLDTATCTDGIFIVRGVGKLITENGTHIPTGTWNGGVTIVNELLTATQLATLGSGLTVAQDIKLDELHKLQGLDVGNPLVVTPDSMDVAGIEIVITGDGETSSTLTRQ